LVFIARRQTIRPTVNGARHCLYLDHDRAANRYTYLLVQIAGPVASFTGDGAYDRDDVYHEVCQRHPDAAVVVPPHSRAAPSATAETAPMKCDQHQQLIAERGRMGWQRASGYNWRALVEADIGRYKRAIGDVLLSRIGGRQTTEVAIAVASLNRMLELGRLEYARLTGTRSRLTRKWVRGLTSPGC
jgi:hypothetical protein